MSNLGDSFMGGKTEQWTIEYTSPLGVDLCVERLRARHQRLTIFALSWLTRMVVKVTPTGPDTYRFKLVRMNRNILMGWGCAVKVNGTLSGVGESQTVVSACASWSALWTIVQVLLLTVMGAVLVMGTMTNEPSLDLIVVLPAMVGALIILVIGMAYVRFWGRAYIQIMMDMLQEATGVQKH